MKRIVFLVFYCIAKLVAIAQSNTKVDDLAAISIGWKAIVKKPTPVTALTDLASGAKFTASEVTTMYNLVNWMQQSWTPKGVLGYAGIVYKPEPRSKTRSFTKYENAPHSYGAFANNYIFLKKDANGKYTHTTTHNNLWSIVVNGVTPFASLSMLNTEEEYYFFIPKVDPKGTSAFNTANFIRQSKLQGFDNHPNLANYSHFYIPALSNNSDIGNGYTILLSKDKQWPFEEVSIGEVLQRATTAAAVNRKRSIERSNPKNKEEQKNIQDAYDRNVKGLEKLNTYYKDKFSNTAKVSPYGFTVNSFSVGGGDYMATDNLEVLEKEFTVYKVSKATQLLCQKEPQWVTVTFTPGLDDKAYTIHRMEAIVGNFNYDYLYNYFFNPELIRNKTYQPIEVTTQQITPSTNTVSPKAIEAAKNTNLLFFDDFSSSQTGKAPALWASNVFNGNSATVTAVPGLEGQWLELRENFVTPKAMKYPLPEWFEWSTDILIPGDALKTIDGLRFILYPTNPIKSGTGPSMTIQFGPNMGRGTGWLKVNTGSTGCWTSSYYEVKDIPTDKPWNKVKLSILRKGNAMEIGMNDKKIADCDKAILPGTQPITKIEVRMLDRLDVRNRYLIGNVKIEKK